MQKLSAWVVILKLKSWNLLPIAILQESEDIFLFFNLLFDWLSWASKTAPRKWKKTERCWRFIKIEAHYFIFWPWRIGGKKNSTLGPHYWGSFQFKKVYCCMYANYNVSSNQEVHTLYILKERKITIKNIHGRVRILSNWTVCMYWHPHYEAKQRIPA